MIQPSRHRSYRVREEEDLGSLCVPGAQQRLEHTHLPATLVVRLDRQVAERGNDDAIRNESLQQAASALMCLGSCVLAVSLPEEQQGE